MRRRQEDHHRRDDGVEGEGDEAEPVDHHRGELPVVPHLGVVLVASHLVGDEAELAQDVLQLARVLKAEGGVRRQQGSSFLVGPAQEAVVSTVVGGRPPRPSSCRRGGARRVDLADVVVDVEHVGQQRAGRPLLELELSHLVVHHDCLARDLLARPVHAQEPRQPLQEHALDLPKGQGGESTNRRWLEIVVRDSSEERWIGQKSVGKALRIFSSSFF